MSLSKDIRMLHLCCAIANACMKQRVGSQAALRHAFLRACTGQGMCHCDKPTLGKPEQTESHMHDDNHYLHIKCFMCGASMENLLTFFVQVYSFSCK